RKTSQRHEINTSGGAVANFRSPAGMHRANSSEHLVNEAPPPPPPRDLPVGDRPKPAVPSSHQVNFFLRLGGGGKGRGALGITGIICLVYCFQKPTRPPPPPLFPRLQLQSQQQQSGAMRSCKQFLKCVTKLPRSVPVSLFDLVERFYYPKKSRWPSLAKLDG